MGGKSPTIPHLLGIGSSTKQGAASLLMDRVLEKLFLSLGCSREAYLNALFDGFMLSLDVAHAIHPNHSEKCDIKNQIDRSPISARFFLFTILVKHHQVLLLPCLFFCHAFFDPEAHSLVK